MRTDHHSPNQGGQYASHKVLPLERQRSTCNAGQSARMACSRRRADGHRAGGGGPSYRFQPSRRNDAGACEHRSAQRPDRCPSSIATHGQSSRGPHCGSSFSDYDRLPRSGRLRSLAREPRPEHCRQHHRCRSSYVAGLGGPECRGHRLLERQQSLAQWSSGSRQRGPEPDGLDPRRPDGDQRAADFTDRHRRECSPRRRERRRGCGHRVGGRGNSVARAGKAMSIFNRKSFSASNASNAPRAYGGMTMRKVWTCVATQLAALALLLASGSASAWQCDFLTGGGFIIRTPRSSLEASGAHGNFGVGGACKDGGDGHGLWGHLEYIDHGTGTSSTVTVLPLNAHWITITDYREWSTSAPDPKTHQPLGARLICGTARTNQLYGDVNFVVYAEDKGEPGDD